MTMVLVVPQRLEVNIIEEMFFSAIPSDSKIFRMNSSNFNATDASQLPSDNPDEFLN